MPAKRIMQGTVLGFDFGKRRIGVAVGQTVTGSARALTCLHCKVAGEAPWPAIQALIEEWRPVQLVVGLPAHLDGSDSTLGAAARAFAEELARRTTLAVDLWGEALSTEAAREALAEQRRQGAPPADRDRLNAQAAAEILGGWLTSITHEADWHSETRI
jgi:putative Holliday junction resolvase